MRDMELLNSYSQQMTHLVSAWTGTAMQAVANNLDNIQLGLDGFGLIPGIGEFADGANAIISAGRGDWANAGLSAAAMIPLLGNAATAGKIAKNAKEAEVALEAAEDVARSVGRLPGATVDKATGQEVGRFIVDSKGNTMIEPVGGRTVAAGKGGVDTHTLYPNGSNYQRLNPQGHGNNPTPHGHGHLPGSGPGMRGQGSSIDPFGTQVPWNSPDAHWPIN